MTPLCGQPMRRHERPGRPVLEDPVCGRPENHPGPHRSEASMARIKQAETQRWEDRGRRRKQRRRTQRLHENLRAVIITAEQVARQRALGDTTRRAA